ncbi:MAG: hypothetical protein MK291_04675 [Planctomycetes bacterium]|nr:hypothetical protein [Planctomycetota bacterium]
MAESPNDDADDLAPSDERPGLRDKVKGKMKDSIVSLATSSYDARADDLEERAVRAMRRAIQEEGERIRELLEHSLVVKRREVRLSLLVILVANLLYLAVWWFVRGDV